MGSGFGANTRVALVTRGLMEMTRMGLALGAQRETFMGLSGIGDLVLTCTDDQSRNRRFGLMLAPGRFRGRVRWKPSGRWSKVTMPPKAVRLVAAQAQRGNANRGADISDRLRGNAPAAGRRRFDESASGRGVSVDEPAAGPGVDCGLDRGRSP